MIGELAQQICINPYHYQRVELAGSGGQSAAGKPNNKPGNALISSLGPMACSSSSSSTSSSSSSISSGLGGRIAQQQQQTIQQPPPQPFSLHQFQFSPSALSDDDDFVGQLLPPVPALQPQQPIFWCSICYYELNSRVGEPFKVVDPLPFITPSN
jgi:hypothetical protein